MNKNKQNKAIGFAILFFIVVLMVGFAFLIPKMAEKYKANQEEKIINNLKSIYTTAVAVDNLDGGLHNDSDNAGTYKILSEKTGFQVYNARQKKKYSLLKDYKTGKIVVWYGEKLRYPRESPSEKISKNDIESLKTEDLFNYDESEGEIVITGFSQAGTKALNAGSVIQIPSSYKGRSVSSIADKAFYGKNIMGVVIIPESVSKVGRDSFSANGETGDSDSIPKPYTGSWKVENGKWIKMN